MTRYLIIEHPTRGVLIELDFDVVSGKAVPHFSPTASRADERVEAFWSADRLRTVLKYIKRDAPNVHAAITVRRSTDWEPIYRWSEAKGFLSNTKGAK